MNDSTVGTGNKWSWAAYLGASWTWCIGMFLPVLLIRDYGPWAWVIFAVPNVVGAAAMGWVMRTREMSHDYTIRHASACRLFSFVTIAFQLFFAGWMLPTLVGPAGWIGVAVIVQSAFTPLTNLRWLRWGGAGALVLSTVAALALSADEAMRWPTMGHMTTGDAFGLTAVCLAGFLACPYLDLTFHRARQATNNGDAKVAFGVGFGVLFALMIVFTFFYAMPTQMAQADNGIGNLTFVAWVLAMHLFVQMTFTVHVHAAELARQARARDDMGDTRGGLGVWLAIGIAGALAAAFAIEHEIYSPFPYARTIGEVVYRIFMAAYGLLFPTYVLLAIGRPSVNTLGWLAVTAVASPFYWLAFIQHQMTWALAGVAVMIVGVLIARRLVPSPGTPGEG